MEARITAILSAKVDAFVSGINQAASRLQKFGQDADRIGVALSVAVSAPLALLGKKAVETAGEFDALRRGLATVEKDADSLGKRLITLAEIAKLPGLGLQEAFKTDLSLRTTLGPLVGYEKAVNLATRAIVAFGNANASVGGGKADFGAAMLQLQQIVSQGKIQGDELNVLASRIPQVRTAIIAAFGTANTELINSKNNAAQIVEKITAELEKLPKATGGIKNSFENLSDFMSISLDRIGTNIAKNFNLNGIVSGITGFIDKIITKFESLSPVTQKIIIVLGAVLTVIPPIIAAVGLLAPAVTAGIAAFKALGVAVSAFSLASGVTLGPLALIAAAVVATAAVIITHWDKVKATLAESGIWDLMKDMIGSALSVITSIFGVFANLIQGDWKNLWQHLVDILKAFWNFGISITQAGVRFIGNALGGLLDFLGAPSNGKKVREFYQGLADTMNSIQFDLPASPTGNLFEGFNFGGTPTPIKPGSTPEQQAAAKKALDDYVKAQSEASKSIVDSLQRTRDISISLIKDETERKRAELKAQASDRRAQAEIEVQNETVKAREIKAINEKLAADLEELDKKSRTLAGVDVKPVERKQNKSVATSTGNDFEVRKDLLSKTNRLPGVDNVLDSINSAADKIKAAKMSIESAFQGLRDSFERAFDGWNVAGAIDSLDKYISAIEAKMSQMSDNQKVAFLSFAQNTSAVFATLGDAMGGAFEAFGQAIATGKNPFAAFGKAIIASFGDMLVMIGKQMLKQAAALAALAIISGGALTPVMGRTAIAGAALVTAGSAMRSIPALAKGGEVFGPTIAMVGDNRNAHIDPELVGPSSTFRKMMREELVGGGRTVHVIGEIRNDRIILANSRGQNERNTLRGK